MDMHEFLLLGENFLQHGLFSHTSSWLTQVAESGFYFPNQSFGFPPPTQASPNHLPARAQRPRRRPTRPRVCPAAAPRGAGGPPGSGAQGAVVRRTKFYGGARCLLLQDGSLALIWEPHGICGGGGQSLPHLQGLSPSSVPGLCLSGCLPHGGGC